MPPLLFVLCKPTQGRERKRVKVPLHLKIIWSLSPKALKYESLEP